MHRLTKGSDPASGYRDASRDPPSAPDGAGQTELTKAGVVVLPLFVGLSLLVVLAVVLLAEPRTDWMLASASSLEVPVIVAGLVWLTGPMTDKPLLRHRGFGRQTMAGITLAPLEGSHQVLVIANRLEDPAPCAAVSSRGIRLRTEAMIVVPVMASSRLNTITDDVDVEQRLGRRDRVRQACQRTVRVAGHRGRSQHRLSPPHTTGPRSLPVRGARDRGRVTAKRRRPPLTVNPEQRALAAWESEGGRTAAGDGAAPRSGAMSEDPATQPATELERSPRPRRRVAGTPPRT
jgi:hypothetical protein